MKHGEGATRARRSSRGGKIYDSGILHEKARHDLIHSPGLNHVGLVPFWLKQTIRKHKAHNARSAGSLLHV